MAPTEQASTLTLPPALRTSPIMRRATDAAGTVQQRVARYVEDGQILEPCGIEAVEVGAGAPVCQHGPVAAGAHEHDDGAAAPAAPHARLHPRRSQLLQ